MLQKRGKNACKSWRIWNFAVRLCFLVSQKRTPSNIPDCTGKIPRGLNTTQRSKINWGKLETGEVAFPREEYTNCFSGSNSEFWNRRFMYSTEDNWEYMCIYKYKHTPHTYVWNWKKMRMIVYRATYLVTSLWQHST